MPTQPISPATSMRLIPATGITALLWLVGWVPGLAQDEAGAEPIRNNAPMESRLVSDSELEDYLTRVAEMLPMATRERDPFGVPQDPDAKPPPPPIVDTPSRFVPESVTALEDVVRLINITTVMPADKKFLVGTRAFSVNDVIPVNFRGRPYRLRVEDVNSKLIRFRNVENDDTATRELDMMPAGMSAGGARPTIPGLIRTGPDVPIDLD